MLELITVLDALARAHGAWVRLHYVYPYPHVDDVVERMATDPGQGGLLPYLDVPFQHASPRILTLMKRPANTEGTLRRIEAWRRARADLAIRSTFIVGFPGETEREFEALLAFLEAAQLDRVGCFAYSAVEGAAANALPGALADDVKEERRARFMATQARISARRLAQKVGVQMTVLVDAHGADGAAVARSAADAPEIDGVVRIRRGAAVPVGTLARVTITGSDEHDLDAEIAG
jgi:ribosomal protein S12 methylthiotransferase